VVERQLAKGGKKKEDLGREAFESCVWAWKEESGGKILSQLRLMGFSLDWSRERFTMDATLSRAVREVFVSLYEAGLVYRGDYIVNWCPRCVTGLSDLEVETEAGAGEPLAHPLSREGRRAGRGGGHHAPRDDAGRHRGGRRTRDERFRALIGRTLVLPSWAARSPWWRTPSWTGSSGPARSRSRPPTIPTTSRPRSAWAARPSTSWTSGPS
jgi:valyl-tRNA synthetase